MKLFLLFLISLGVLTLSGCAFFQSKIAPALAPLESAGCAIETGLSGSGATAIATALTCTNQAAIQASLLVALGNANLCKLVVPPAGAVKTQGLVGSLACPIAVNTIIGFLTNSVPTTWGCAQGASVSALVLSLTAACEASVPI